MLGIVSYSRYKSWGVRGSFSPHPPPPETIRAPPAPRELAGRLPIYCKKTKQGKTGRSNIERERLRELPLKTKKQIFKIRIVTSLFNYVKKENCGEYCARNNSSIMDLNKVGLSATIFLCFGFYRYRVYVLQS